VTVIYSAECIAAHKATKPVAMLPLLVILFIVSYGILTMLVFEQGQTIESQRGLIREMLKDSTQLAAMKGKMAADDNKRMQRKMTAPAVGAQANPSNNSAAPSADKNSKDEKKPGKSTNMTKQIPGKPPADLEDVRRSTRII
jgi:hypothetical protein